MNEISRPSSACEAALRQYFHYYLEARSLEGVRSMLSEQIISLGLRGEEIARNKAEFEKMLENEFSKLSSPIFFTYRDYTEIETAPHCYVCFAKLEMKLHPQQIEPYRTRITAGFRLENGVYKIYMQHMSVVSRKPIAQTGMSMYYKTGEAINMPEAYRIVLMDMMNGMVPCGIVGTYMQKGMPIYIVNNVFLEMMGYSRDEFFAVSGGKMENIIHPSDYNRVYVQMQQAYADKNECHAESRLRRKGGGHLWVYHIAHNMSIETGEDIQINLIVNISQNLSIKGEYFTNASERLRRMDDLSREYPAIFYVNAKEETYTPYMLSLKNNLTYHMQEFKENPIGQTAEYYIENRVAPIDRDYARRCVSSEAVLKNLREKGFYNINYRICNEGKIEHAQLHIIRAENEYSQIWAFRSIENIVQEEQLRQQELEDALEKAQKAERAKTSFLFNMSHDIRTPMNAIIGFNTLAQKHYQDPDRVMDALQKSEIASQHLLDLINDVLEMARIENGKLDINEKIIDTRDCIAELQGMFEASMKERKIDFVIDCRFREQYIYLDVTHVMQIMTNLVGNAMKFTKPGGRIICRCVQLEELADGYHQFEIHVIDTGIGMSREFQKRLFDAFERERTSTDSGMKGTGLGLAISRHIAEMLGGSLTCSSELGKGSHFILRFQARSADGPEKKDDIITQIGDIAEQFSGKRLLLAEDNPLNREIAEEMLSDCGFIVETVNDGAAAVERVKQSTAGYYDLVLMDIQMPYMDGYTASAEIRRLSDPALSEIPIVAMTANAFDEDRRQALEAGMNDHLGKPIRMKELVRVLNLHLKR